MASDLEPTTAEERAEFAVYIKTKIGFYAKDMAERLLADLDRERERAERFARLEQEANDREASDHEQIAALEAQAAEYRRALEELRRFLMRGGDWDTPSMMEAVGLIDAALSTPAEGQAGEGG